jgi:hypothetical protein
VTTPHDPDDDGVGNGNDDVSRGVSADEAAWRSIIDNYGDRPEIADEPEIEVPPSPRGVYPEEEQARELEPVDAEEHFVPPPPPPLPMPEPRRLLAWLGLFGVPTLVLVCLLTSTNLPNWLGLILMVWFVGGFVYLVASMRPGAGDDFDDGAVL